MIKVAYVLTPVEFGGSEKVNLLFLKNFDKSRFHILPILFVRPWEGPPHFLQKLTKHGISFRIIPVALKPRQEGRDLFRVLRSIKYLHRFLLEEPVDVVHTHGYFADLTGFFASRLVTVPQISSCHGFIETNGKLHFYNLLNKMCLHFSRRIIVVSEALKNDLTHFGIPAQRIAVIQNAVEDPLPEKTREQCRAAKRAVLEVSNDVFLIGYVGRLSPEKGLLGFLEACAMMRKESSIPFKVVLIGSGSELSKLMAFCESSKLNDVVIFLGFQPDVQTWLPALDLFVLPSLTEGTPMALLEAMSAEVAIVASNVGGIPDIIASKRNGVLVPRGEAQQLARAMLSVMGNTEFRRTLSKQACQLVKDSFGLSAWCRRIEAEYTKSLSSNPAS